MTPPRIPTIEEVDIELSEMMQRLDILTRAMILFGEPDIRTEAAWRAHQISLSAIRLEKRLKAGS